MKTLKKIQALLTPAELNTAWILLTLMVLGMMLETLSIGLVIPSLSLMLQDDFFVQRPSISNFIAYLGNPTQSQLIIYAMVSLFIIYVMKNLFLAFLAWRQICFAANVQINLSQRLFTIYLRQPYTFHLNHNSAQLIRNVAGEVSIYSNAITSTLMIVTESLVLFGIAILLLIVEPLGASIVVIVTGIAAFLYNTSTRSSIGRWGLARQHHEGLRIKHLQQGLGGAKDVKLLGRENDFLEQYQIHNAASAKVGVMQSTLQQFPRLFLELLTITGLVILVISMLSQHREISTIIPTLGLFAAAAFRLMPSVNRILNALQTLRYSMPAVNVLYKETDLIEPKMVETTQSNTNFQSEIRLENIYYKYSNSDKPAINGISLTITKGQSVGFIGTSGSGKSTLIDIILGLLPPSEGKVTVDNEDIQNNLRQWQDQIGYVPQSIYLTDDTLRRNVAFGLSAQDIDDAAVSRAIKAAQLEDFVAGLPDRLETVVGERGIKLSGGQRQRIGIARALYHDPSILVLDEATSALDTKTESGVIEAITALKGYKTLIIVAHRLSTVEGCDKLYLIEHGKTVREGTAQEVLVGI